MVFQRSALVVGGFVLLFGLAASAGTITPSKGVPIGGLWIDGFVDPSGGTATFDGFGDAAGAPFNLYNGVDADEVDGGQNFSATWTIAFNPALLTGAITGVSLELGLFDHDSAAPGSQVASFLVNGVDVTAALNTALEGHGGANFEYNIYNLILPASVFPTLTGGSASFTLNLQGPGLVEFIGFPDVFETERNGAGLDYSTLTINFQDSNGEVPEPTTLALSALGLLAIGLARRRRSTPSGGTPPSR